MNNATTRVALPGAGDCGGRRFSAVPPQTVDLPGGGTGKGPRSAA